MKYMGGKHRIAPQLVAAMGNITGDYYEPFVGGANVVCKVIARKRFASDAHVALIHMWQAIQAGWVPPSSVTKQDHIDAKNLPDTNPLKAFIGFGCCFGGAYFAGFARNKRGVTDTEVFPRAAYNGIKKKMHTMQDVQFSVSDYREIIPVSGDTLYADPPYINTTPYKGVEKFDHSEFWNVMTQHAKNGVRVFVSEYVAPKDWRPLIEIPTKTCIRTKENGNEPRLEKLFVHRDSTL